MQGIREDMETLSTRAGWSARSGAIRGDVHDAAEVPTRAVDPELGSRIIEQLRPQPVSGPARNDEVGDALLQGREQRVRTRSGWLHVVGDAVVIRAMNRDQRARLFQVRIAGQRLRRGGDAV